MSIDKPLLVAAAQAQPTISKMTEEELAKSIRDKISMMLFRHCPHREMARRATTNRGVGRNLLALPRDFRLAM
jgi:hypothetical protein